MLREMFLVLCTLAVSGIAHAEGLGATVEKAGPQAAMFFYGLVTIVLIGSIGLMGNVVLSLFEENKIAKIVTKATYFGAAGVMIVMAIGFLTTIAGAITKFIQLVGG